MDKKNTTIGVVLLLAAFAVFILGPKSPPPTQPTNAQPAATASQAPASVAPGAAATTQPEAAAAGGTTPAAPAVAPSGEFAAVHREAAGANIVALSNEFIEARFTNHGGALRDVAFKKHAAVQGKPEPYVFNLVHEDPLLALTEYPGLGRDKAYDLVSSSADEVVYRTVLDGRVEVTRRYRLTKEGEPGGDPYRVYHETTFRNLTAATAPLGRAGLSIGTASLLNASDAGMYLHVANYDGDEAHYTERGDLEGGGFMSMFSPNPPKALLEKPGRVVWAATKNQFFTSIYTPEAPGSGLVIRRIDLTQAAPFPPPHENQPNVGLTAATRFDLPALAPNGTAKLAGMLYVGPQEYRRIAKFEQREERLLPYYHGFNSFFLSGFVAPLLNVLMNALHRLVNDWGVAIVLMTIVLKIVSLPFTIAASKSAKRMAKLQPLMQEIREKYKDNPQKQQMATMELFKTHKVNPLGGCIPILITFPLFVGFFAMLQCTSELRFQSFLWAKDLAAPDTIGHLWVIPINIMPLLMGATMYYQMRLTPTPSVDNMQLKMMRFMPVIFTFFCYNFSCALSLYSTINGLFTIGQQMVINRMKDDPGGPASPGTAAATTASAFGRKVKNVTPKKR